MKLILALYLIGVAFVVTIHADCPVISHCSIYDVSCSCSTCEIGYNGPSCAETGCPAGYFGCSGMPPCYQCRTCQGATTTACTTSANTVCSDSDSQYYYTDTSGYIQAYMSASPGIPQGSNPRTIISRVFLKSLPDSTYPVWGISTLRLKTSISSGVMTLVASSLSVGSVSSTTVTADQWYYTAVSYSGTALTLWWSSDGVTWAHNSATIALSTDSSLPIIGFEAEDVAFYKRLKMSYFRIFSRELSQSDLSVQMAFCDPGSQGLVYEFNFNSANLPMYEQVQLYGQALSYGDGTLQRDAAVCSSGTSYGCSTSSAPCFPCTPCLGQSSSHCTSTHNSYCDDQSRQYYQTGATGYLAPTGYAAYYATYGAVPRTVVALVYLPALSPTDTNQYTIWSQSGVSAFVCTSQDIALWVANSGGSMALIGGTCMSGGVSVAVPIPGGAWYYVAMTYAPNSGVAGGVMTVWWGNGGAWNFGAVDTPSLNSYAPLFIGYRAALNGYPYPGLKVKYVRAWKRALYNSGLTQAITGGSSRCTTPFTDLTLEYDFNTHTSLVDCLPDTLSINSAVPLVSYGDGALNQDCLGAGPAGQNGFSCSGSRPCTACRSCAGSTYPCTSTADTVCPDTTSYAYKTGTGASYLTIGTVASSIPQGNSDRTIIARVYINALAQPASGQYTKGAIWSVSPTTGCDLHDFGVTAKRDYAGNYYVSVNSCTTDHATVAAAVGWNYVAVTYSAGSLYLYVTPDGTTWTFGGTTGLTLQTSLGVFDVGLRPQLANLGYTGLRMSYIRMWNRALTLLEVSSITQARPVLSTCNSAMVGQVFGLDFNAVSNQYTDIVSGTYTMTNYGGTIVAPSP